MDAVGVDALRKRLERAAARNGVLQESRDYWREIARERERTIRRLERDLQTERARGDELGGKVRRLLLEVVHMRRAKRAEAA